jgi:transcription elongation factor Elf1
MKEGKNVMIQDYKRFMLHSDCPECGAPQVAVYITSPEGGSYQMVCEDCEAEYDIRIDDKTKRI